MTSSVATHPPKAAEYRRVAVASMIGTTVEWYDFFIYANAAGLVFAQLFFSPLQGTTAQILSFLTVGISFVFRPLGAVVAGHLGDRVGRKQMLVLTLGLMGAATVLIGLLPTYATIGIAAPLLLILLRIVQGFSTGGEWGGAALLAVEHAPSDKRGYYGAYPQMGVPLGMLLATGILAVCTWSMSDEQFLSWGWRLPFLLSAVLIATGYFIRRKVSESPVFEELKERKVRTRQPLSALFRTHPKKVVLASLSFVGTQANGYMVVGGFVVGYAAKGLGVDRTLVLLAAVAGAISWGFFTMVGAKWSDRGDRTKVMMVGNLALLLFAIPFFMLIDSANIGLIVLAMVLFSVGLGIAYGPQSALFAEMFPPSIRYSGASISYAIGAVLGGAFAPTAAAWLQKVTGGTLAISFYLMIVTAVSLVALRLIEHRSGRDLSETV